MRGKIKSRRWLWWSDELDGKPDAINVGGRGRRKARRGKSGMDVGRSAFGCLDTALHRLFWVAEDGVKERKRCHARCDNLLISYRAFVARTLRSTASVAADALLEGAAPLFSRIVCSTVDHGIGFSTSQSAAGSSAKATAPRSKNEQSIST